MWAAPSPAEQGPGKGRPGLQENGVRRRQSTHALEGLCVLLCMKEAHSERCENGMRPDVRLCRLGSVASMWGCTRGQCLLGGSGEGVTTEGWPLTLHGDTSPSTGGRKSDHTFPEVFRCRRASVTQKARLGQTVRFRARKHA